MSRCERGGIAETPHLGMEPPLLRTKNECSPMFDARRQKGSDSMVDCLSEAIWPPPFKKLAHFLRCDPTVVAKFTTPPFYACRGLPGLTEQVGVVRAHRLLTDGIGIECKQRRIADIER